MAERVAEELRKRPLRPDVGTGASERRAPEAEGGPPREVSGEGKREELRLEKWRRSEEQDQRDRRRRSGVGPDRGREPAKDGEDEGKGHEEASGERRADRGRAIEHGEPGDEPDPAEGDPGPGHPGVERERERARRDGGEHRETRPRRRGAQGARSVAPGSSMRIGRPAGAMSGGTTRSSGSGTGAPRSSTN